MTDITVENWNWNKVVLDQMKKENMSMRAFAAKMDLSLSPFYRAWKLSNVNMRKILLNLSFSDQIRCEIYFSYLKTRVSMGLEDELLGELIEVYPARVYNCIEKLFADHTK